MISKHKIGTIKSNGLTLREVIEKRRGEELLDALEDMKRILAKVPDKEIVRVIRESRGPVSVFSISPQSHSMKRLAEQFFPRNER